MSRISWAKTRGWRAEMAAVVGDRRRAVALLRDAHGEGLFYSIWLHTGPTLDSLRGFGQFEEFVRARN